MTWNGLSTATHAAIGQRRSWLSTAALSMPQWVRRTRQIDCCVEGGEEELAFPPVDDHATRNGGLFGVDLNYQCVITCDPESSGLLNAYLLAKMTAGEYFGAADISMWINTPDRHVPPIFWTNPNGTDPRLNIVNLTESGALVLGFPFQAVLNVRVANAGAATMPFILLLTNLAYDIAP